MKSYSICIFSTFLYPHIGGVERYAWELARFLSRVGHKVTIVTVNTENLPEIDNYENIKIYRFFHYPFLKGRFPLIRRKSRFLNFFYAEELHKSDLFIINMRFYHLSYFAGCLAKKYKIPAILVEHVTGHFTVHNKFFDFLGHIYEHFITRLIKNKIRYFYGVSEASSRWLLHYGIKADGVIYNGIDPELSFRYENVLAKYGLPEGKKIVLYAGRLLKEKGLDNLIEVFDLVNSQIPSAILVIIGGGYYYSYLEEKIKDYRNVYLTGEVSHNEVLNFINCASVIVNPSSYPEGMPTILLEAGILKKPVVATSVGGAKELITNNVNGFLIAPNDKQELFEALVKVLSDIKQAEELGMNLYRRVCNEFAWNNIVEKLLVELENKLV